MSTYADTFFMTFPPYFPWLRNFQDGTGFNFYPLRDPVFANGTTIPNGLYRVRVSVLKVTGDPTREKDFESWLSPIVGVQVPAE